VKKKPTPRVALIGASGFIGLRCAELLGHSEELSLVPLVRSPSSLAVLARQPLDWRITSFVDEAALTRALEDCEYCVHAAIGDAAQITRMAEVACRACAAAGVRRLVWLSSASVHGQNCAPGTNDSSPLRDDQAMVYNNAKVRAEWTLQKLARDGRVELIMLRPGVVFGPRSRWIADAAHEIRQGRAAWLNRGEGICNSIYVDNLVDAIRLALISPAPASNVFLVGDRETVTWRDFLLPIAQHFGRDASAFAELPIPSYAPEAKARWSALTQTPAYGAVGNLVPDRAKRLVKGLLRAWPSPQPSAGAWTYRQATMRPALTQELALLQQCTWKFPHDLATTQLGYSPRVPFAEGLERSLAWLDFAEGRTEALPPSR
jgi:nucleoside-diphosphate-sugar epimerase